MLRVIELFSGIGAQRRGLEKAGIEHEIVGISEIDRYAIASYNAIFGDTPNFGDITKIEKLPLADLWTYSFPCTDISLAGRMDGFDKDSGTRSSLLWEVQRLLAKANEDNALPRFLLMENVKNLVSRKFKPLFDEWCAFLENLGYRNFYKVLNAKDYGIPQNRERVFMLSIRDRDALYQFPQAIELDTKLGDYLEKNVDEKYYLSSKMIDCFTDMKDRNGLLRGLQFTPKYAVKDKVARTITTKAGSRPCDNYIVEPVISLDGKVIVPQATKDGYAIAEVGDGIYTNRCISKRGVVQKDKIPTLKTSSNDIAVVVQLKRGYAVEVKEESKGTNGIDVLGNYSKSGYNATQIVGKNGIAPTVRENHGQVTAVTITKDTDNYIQWEKDGFFDIECRAFKEDKVSGALNTRGHMKVLTNDVAIRRLTPLECFRLMGFEDEDYLKVKELQISDTQCYKMAGNSIVVNCLTEIFKKLKEII